MIGFSANTARPSFLAQPERIFWNAKPSGPGAQNNMLRLEKFLKVLRMLLRWHTSINRKVINFCDAIKEEIETVVQKKDKNGT